MPAIGTIKRRDLIAGLRQLGIAVPFRGGRHQLMRRGTVTVILPNPDLEDFKRNVGVFRAG